jgi:hypothetical protein
MTGMMAVMTSAKNFNNCKYWEEHKYVYFASNASIYVMRLARTVINDGTNL